MAQSNFYDDEDDSFWSRIFKPTAETETATPPPPPPHSENFNAQTYAAALIKQPILPPSSDLAQVPDLRTAANKKFVESGLYGDLGADASAPSAAWETAAETPPVFRPPSWKLPGTSAHPTTILGDDTAFGPGVRPVPPIPTLSLADPVAQRETAPSDGGLRPPPPPPALPEAPTLPAPNAIPAEPAAPQMHPEAQVGLMLTAADSILRKAGEAVSRVLGGSPELVQQAFDALGAVIKAVLPPEHHASVDKSADAAMSEAQRRTDERRSADRNRAAIQTLTQRSAAMAREHQDALISGDPVMTAEARREAVQAWRAGRLARGDSPSEANAGASALDRQMRDDALRQRLTQRDDAGMQRILETDEDAKADPAAAQRLADHIRRIRRDDPARAGHASVEREIAKRKADGRIDGDEEEKRERAKLRWQAQAQRGIPEDQRRVFTIEERAEILTQAEQILDPVERSKVIEARAAEAGPLAEQAKSELTQSVSTGDGPKAVEARPQVSRDGRADSGAVVPAQHRTDPNQSNPEEDSKPRQAEAENVEAKARDELRGKIEREAEELPSEFDPRQKLGQPSRIKRAFALLKYADHPAFDALARELDFDPVRLRAIARLLTARPGDYGAVTEELFQGLSDVEGRVKDLGFFIKYDGHLRSLIGTATRPDGKTDPGEDSRSSAVLDLLDHTLSSRVRGKLADEVDVNNPSGEWLRKAIEEVLQSSSGDGAIAHGALAAVITSIIYRRKRGLKAQKIGAENLRRALEKYGITVDEGVPYKTAEGDTLIDFVLRVGPEKRILRLIEHKTPKASWYGKQKARQEAAAKEEGVPIDIMRTAPTTGRSTVNGMPFEDYVKEVVRQARRRK